MENRRKIGLLLMICSLFSVTIGAGEYLYASRSYLGAITREYSYDSGIAKNGYYYVYYEVPTSPIVLNFSIAFHFRVASNETIDFYIMNSSQFNQWKNNSSMSAVSAQVNVTSGNGTLTPSYQDTYYFLLDNSNYNKTKSFELYISPSTTTYLVDFSEAWLWFGVLGAGFLLLVVACFLTGNPVNLLIRIVCDKMRVPKIKKTEDPEIRRRITRQTVILTWICLLFIVVGVGVVLLSELIPAIPDIPGEILPIMYDMTFRMFLFVLLTGALPLCVFLVIASSLFTLMIDVDTWFFQLKNKRTPHPKFAVVRWKYAQRHLVSLRAVLWYVLGVALIVSGYVLGEIGFMLYLAGAIIFAIPWGESMFTSLKETCKELNLKWKTELKRDMAVSVNAMLVMMWLLFIALFMLKFILSSSLSIGNVLVFQSSTYPMKEQLLPALLTPGQISGYVDVLFSKLLISMVFFIALWMAMTYQLLPLWSSKSRRKKRVGAVLFPIIVALFSAATGEMLAYIVSPQSLSNPIASLCVPVSAGVAAYLADKAFEELH